MNSEEEEDIYSILNVYPDFRKSGLSSGRFSRKSPKEVHYMYFVVNGELNMQKGKIASQVAHAAEHITEHCVKYHPDLWKKYIQSNTPKIVLKTRSQHELLDIISKTSDIFKSYIIDAGRTQIPEDSLTVVGYIPMVKCDVPDCIENLKLL